MGTISKTPKPRLRSSDLVQEISKRTNIANTRVQRVLDTLEDIIVQCLTNKVEVPLCHLGVFTYRIVPPREHIEWNTKYGPEGRPVVFYQDKADGYLRFAWRFFPTIKRRLKDSSIIPYGSLPAEDGGVEYNPVSDEYIDFNKYMAEKDPERYEYIQKQRAEYGYSEIDEYDLWFGDGEEEVEEEEIDENET